MSITLMVDGPDPLNKIDQVRLITDPDAILAALAEAGVLEVEPQEAFEMFGYQYAAAVRYVSPWKETK